MKKTKQQVANLREALEVWWPSVPEANVFRDLGWWRETQGNDPPEVTCNTIACFGGWACLWPPLQAQGLVPDNEGVPKLVNPRTQERIWDEDAERKIFGDRKMFCTRGVHPSDTQPGAYAWSDHELVRQRLIWALAHKEQQ